MRLTAFLFAACVVASSCDDADPDITDAECDELRDRAIELSLASADLPPEVQNAHRAQLREALGAEYRARCHRMTDAERACRLAAASPDDLTSCTGGSR